MLYSVFRVEPLAGLFWTLEVEIVFYLLCLVLFLCGWLYKPIMFFVAGLALMTVYQLLVDRPDLRAIVDETLNTYWKGMSLYLAMVRHACQRLFSGLYPTEKFPGWSYLSRCRKTFYQPGALSVEKLGSPVMPSPSYQFSSK
jgi:peptidoglycan/LPS O-acetylase OafA/YrhL